MVSVEDQALGFVPSDAGVGDRDAVIHGGNIRKQFLISGVDVAFDHDADDVVVAIDALLQDVFKNDVLATVVFQGVGVTAIDEQSRRQVVFFQMFRSFFDA